LRFLTGNERAFQEALTDCSLAGPSLGRLPQRLKELMALAEEEALVER
jgi:hypothetical protein